MANQLSLNFLLKLNGIISAAMKYRFSWKFNTIFDNYRKFKIDFQTQVIAKQFGGV